jgi:membrane protease YdiL (CAAX protease family)
MATTASTLTTKRLSAAHRLGASARRLQRWYASFSRHLWVAAIILLAVAASATTLVFAPIAGVIVNAAVLVLLIGLALWKEPIRKLAISVGVLPVALMLSASLPPHSAFVQSIILYVTMLLLTLVYRFIFTLEQPLSFTKLSLRGYAFALPLMVVLGQLLGLLGYGLLRQHYAYTNVDTGLVALCAIMFAFTEEMLFRGLIQQQAAKVMHPTVAAILSAGLFALVAINHTTILTPLFALAAGAVLAATYYKKQNLILTTTINATLKLTYLGLLATFVLH